MKPFQCQRACRSAQLLRWPAAECKVVRPQDPRCLSRSPAGYFLFKPQTIDEILRQLSPGLLASMTLWRCTPSNPASLSVHHRKGNQISGSLLKSTAASFRPNILLVITRCKYSPPLYLLSIYLLPVNIEVRTIEVPLHDGDQASVYKPPQPQAARH